MKKEHIIDWQDLAPSDYYLFGPMKVDLRGKHYASDEEVKFAVMNWLKFKTFSVSVILTV